MNITQASSRNSITSGPNLPLLSVTAAVGDILVLLIAAGNAGAAGISSISGVSDSAGNTWTDRGTTNQTPGGVAADGTTHSQWTTLVSTPLAAGTVTVAFSPNTITKAAILLRIQPGAGEQLFYGSAGSPGFKGAGTSWSTGTIVGVALGYTLFGSTAVKVNAQATADTDTTNGSWSTRFNEIADTGTASTSQSITAQYKTVTATGDQSYDAGTGASRQYAGNWLTILTVVTDGVGSATGDGDALGVPASEVAAVGSASGDGTATGVSATDIEVRGRAAGYSRAEAVSDYALIAPGIAPNARILFRFNWVNGNVTRLWLGAGPYVDADGVLWRGAALIDEDQLDEIEQAINGDAVGLDIAVNGIAPETAQLVWDYNEAGLLLDSQFSILIQACDRNQRPAGPLRVMFTGPVVNAIFEDSTDDEERFSNVVVQVENKFSLRRIQNGSVLSDADQRIYSAKINPAAPVDRSCERVILMQIKTIVWPRFT